jgi:branched-chain amino acid transport system ATP-binding protein
LLEVDALTAGYGEAVAVRQVSFALEAGQILSIVGPNGAGKTTALMSIAGMIKPKSGKVTLSGTDVTAAAAHRIARRGMCLIPDDRGMFPDLTVNEHFHMAERSAAVRKRTKTITLDQVMESFPRLRALRGRRCGLLSGGEQQMLAIAKVLLLSPGVLMVDELSMGLAPVIVKELLPTLQRLARDLDMAVVLVEQHYELALAIADYAIVLNHGRVVLEGPAEELVGDRHALESAYLGRDPKTGEIVEDLDTIGESDDARGAPGPTAASRPRGSVTA